MLRNVIAVVVGIAVAFATVLLTSKLGHTIYPPPEGLDFGSSDAASYFATLPITALLIIILSPMLAAFVGIMIACYIGTSSSTLYAIVIGGIVLARSIAYFIAFHHPHWLTAATLLGIVGASLLAIRLAPPSGTALPELFDDDSSSG